MDTAVSAEIVVGSLVGLRQTHEDPDVWKRLRSWIKTYRRGPFCVCGMIDSSHVSLEDAKGKLIHFGSTADPSIHIGYVESWRE